MKRGDDTNIGEGNSGDHNTGNGNTGDYNTGDYNTGNCNTGFFNTDEPTLRLFNKDTGLKRHEIDIPYVNLLTTEWVEEKDMTSYQKISDPDYRIKGGTLITRTYKEAWAKAWSEMNQETKDRFLNLPNFDPEIFLEITGIDVRKEETSCDGRIVEIDGKKYKLQEIE
jgi:hypothetical protein